MSKCQRAPSVESERRADHLQKQMPKALLVGRSACIGFDSDQEATLKVTQSVQVEKEVVDLVLRDDIVRLQLPLIVLGGDRGQHLSWDVKSRPDSRWNALA